MSSLRNKIVVIALGLASCAGTAQAALQAVDPGPYTAATGFFPLFYRDTNNLSLDLCLSNAITLNGPLCLLGANPGIFDPSQPTVFPVNFPDEAFYFTADANVVGQGVTLGYVAHLEAAFAVGAPTAGAQITFARIRVRADFAVTVPAPGFYRITHPYGIEEFSVAAPGQRVINATRDIGIGLPGDFSGALAGDIGPFLRRAAAPGGAPLPFIQGLDPATLQPTGELFIGDPNVPQFATGSPFGAARNLVRIQRIASLGGAPIGGIDVSSNQFLLSGRVWNGQRTTAVTVERATYSRTLNPDLTARTRIEAFADSAPGASVCFRETLPLLSGTPPDPCQTAMQGDGAGKFFGQDPDAQLLPPYIVVTAVNAGTTRTSIAQPLVDVVKVLQAQFDRQTRTLVIRATSSDQAVRPTITALGLGNLSPVSGTLAEQRLQLVLAAEPPAFVTLVSSAGGRQTEPVTVAAIQNNRPPLANPDTATTPEDTPVTIAVLANDTDPDGDALTVTAVSGVTNGTATINANGTVTFTPALNFNGIGRFTYSIADGRGGSAGASVAVTVNGVNDRPVAVNDTATTPMNTALNIAVLANDIDVDGNALTVTTVTQPANGTVVINNPGTPGNTVRFTPAANFFGVASFAYAVSDGNGGTAAASVSVTVTSPPVDLDIATFRVPNAVRIGRALGAVTVTVRNNGTFDAPRTATLTATQNGVQVLTRSLQVSDPVGGGTTQFVIPTFTPAAAGTITWRFEIFDDNPDVDVATGTTSVNP